MIQDLKLETWNTRYERARYDLPGGGSVLAPLPAGVLPVEGGHFGAKLVAFILSQHYQAMVTQPVLLEQLWDYGIDISSGQLHGILTENKDHFHQEKAELLSVGLTTATYIGTDDTGARHQGKNGYTTAIGNDLFAYFETTDNKSRLNFLHVLQGDLTRQRQQRRDLGNRHVGGEVRGHCVGHIGKVAEPEQLGLGPDGEQHLLLPL